MQIDRNLLLQKYSQHLGGMWIRIRRVYADNVTGRYTYVEVNTIYHDLWHIFPITIENTEIITTKP